MVGIIAGVVAITNKLNQLIFYKKIIYIFVKIGKI